MGVISKVTQRLFGRTAIDSLDLNQGAWYIDDVAVTATADALNTGEGGYPPKSVTASTLASDVAGNNMVGADGIPLTMSPFGFHLSVAAGTGIGVNVPVPEMSVGDVIRIVAALKPGISLTDRTSEYTAGAGAMIKAAGTNETGNFLMYYWINRT